MIPPGELESYLARARTSPRINEMFSSFARIASGREGVPATHVSMDPELLGNDRAALDFARVRGDYAGAFNAHFVASVPYALEEQCRLGAALLDYCLGMDHPPSVYTLGDGPGVAARALTRASGGRITTLNCSPNVENLLEFSRNRPAGSHFFHAPFFELTPERRRAIADGVFTDGFDVIVEDTTFQMYGAERVEPIALALRHLKPDGVLILIDKLNHPDPQEFLRRERQKDQEFKSAYFSAESIADKSDAIVAAMNTQLATLGESAAALSVFFDHAVVTWNSGNFYTLAASNCAAHLRRLVNAMTPPAVPAQFGYEELPRVLVSPASAAPQDGPYRFRSAAC